MGDQSGSSNWSKKSKLSVADTQKTVSKVSSVPKAFWEKDCKSIGYQNHVAFGSGIVGDAAFFLLKVATLEALRRFTSARCPLAWQGVQALQLLCYPPFKWIQRWFPFKGLIKGIQAFSWPFLALSVATSLSDWPTQTSHANDHNDSQPSSSRDAESPSVDTSVNTRFCDEAADHLPDEIWLQNLLNELEKQGIKLPERINENVLQRFYVASNGDFSAMFAAVKKTIRWREIYNILSQQELELWSHMIFWHGYDVKHRPCLVLRLGLAMSLPADERPRFAQAIVSQVEYGVVHLVDEGNPQITVLLDCERLPSLRLPIQMMRSCSVLLQDHFPNRLGCLFVIRLPPVVRVMAQTFIHVLKPVTRQKLKFLGMRYHGVLSEQLEVTPAYLGGKCSCSKCSGTSFCDTGAPRTTAATNEIEPSANISDNDRDDDLSVMDPCSQFDMNEDHSCEQVLRTAVIAVLMIWVFIAFVAGVLDTESRSFLPP